MDIVISIRSYTDRYVQCSCMHAFWVLSILVSLSGSSVKIGIDVCKEYAQKLIIRGQVLFNAKMIVNKSLSRHLRLLILFNVAGKFVHLMTADCSQMVYSEIRTININIKSCPGPAPSQCWATVVWCVQVIKSIKWSWSRKIFEIIDLSIINESQECPRAQMDWIFSK